MVSSHLGSPDQAGHVDLASPADPPPPDASHGDGPLFNSEGAVSCCGLSGR